MTDENTNPPYPPPFFKGNFICSSWDAQMVCARENYGEETDGFPIQDVGNDESLRSSPQVVSGDPSEEKRRWIPD